MAMINPFAALDNRLRVLDDPVAAALARHAARQSQPAMPDLPPEEAESLLGNITGGTLSALQYVGETLDKPGRAFRGLLAGRPEELANLVPFSDAMGLTNPNEQTTGRDLLEQAGVLGPNQEGFDWGDVGGFAAEVALDPLTWLLGPGKAFTKKGTDAFKAGRVMGTSPARTIEEIANGERALLATQRPGLPFHRWLGFGAPGPVRPIPGLSGKLPAAAMKKLYYGKYSPIRYMRNAFDARVKGFTHGAAQIAADKSYSEALQAQSNIWDFNQQMLKKKGEAEKVYSDLIQNADDPLPFEDAFKSFLEDPDNGLPAALQALEDSVRPVPAAVKVFITQADKKALREMGYADDAIRNMRPEEAANILGQNAAHVTPEQLTAAKDSLGQIADEMAKIRDASKDEMRQLGLRLKDLEDAYVRHMPRRPGNKKVADQLDKLRAHQAKLINTDFPFAQGRDLMYKNVPGGTRTINRFTSDPLVTAVRNNPSAHDLWDYLIDSDQYKPTILARDVTDYQRHIRELAEEHNIDPKVLKQAARDNYNEVKALREESYQTTSRLYDSVKGRLGKTFTPKYIAKLENQGLDYKAIQGFDEVVDGLRYQDEFAYLIPDDPAEASSFVWDMLREGRPKRQPYRLKSYENLSEAAYRAAGVNPAAKQKFIDEVNAKLLAASTSGGKGGKWSKAAAARYLADKYNLPTAWDYERLLQEQVVKEGGQWAKGLAPDDFAFEYRKQWSGLNPEKAAEWQHLDDTEFFDELYSTPELNPLKTPMRTLDDLEQLADHLSRMPVDILRTGEVLGEYDDMAEAVSRVKQLNASADVTGNFPASITKDGDKYVVRRSEGLFNRDAITDQMDYLMHAATVKAGLLTVHRVLASDLVGENQIGQPLSEVWQKMRLTDEGLVTLMRSRKVNIPDGPDAAKMAMKAASKLTVPQGLSDALTRVMDAHLNPETPSAFGKLLDSFNSLFKTHVTLPFVNFHSRNFVSGQWANWAANQFSARSVNDSIRLIRGLAIKGWSYDEIIDEVLTHGVIGNGNIVDEAATDMLPKRGGVLGPIKNVVRHPIESFKQGALNFFNVRGSGDPLKALRGKASLTDRAEETAEGLLQLGGEGGPVSKKFAFAEAGENAHHHVEFINRVAPYIELRRRGYTPAQAAREVKMAQFDYSELSHFEKRWMRRIVPFYSFMRKNLPHQLKKLIDEPGGRTAQTIRAMNVARREGEKEGVRAPSWLAEGLAFPNPLGTNKPGSTSFVSSFGLLPIEEAFNRFTPDPRGGFFPLNVKRTFEKTLSTTHPFISKPAEWMTGKQLWSGRPRKSLYSWPVDSELVNTAIAQSPFGRYSSYARNIADERKAVWKKVVNSLIGGMRLTDIDDKAILYEAQDLLGKDLAEAPGIRQYTRPYIASPEEADPDTLRQMALFNFVVQELRKRRQEEAAQ